MKTPKNKLGTILLASFTAFALCFTACSKKEESSTPNAPFEKGAVINGSVWSIDSVQVILGGTGDETVLAKVFVDNGNPNQVVHVRLQLTNVFNKTPENTLGTGYFIETLGVIENHKKNQPVEMWVYIDDLVNDDNDTRYQPHYGLCQKEYTIENDVQFMFDIENQTMFFEKTDAYELCIPNSYEAPEIIAPLTMTNFRVDHSFRLFK